MSSENPPGPNVEQLKLMDHWTVERQKRNAPQIKAEAPARETRTARADVKR